MTECDDSGQQKICSEDPQRMLILAYTRLFLLPERTDGSKLTTIGSVGHYDVRLVELPIGTTPSTVHPLWIELFDTRSGSILDSVGCKDLLDAGAATEVFIAAAKRRCTRPDVMT
jgi:hypothetical protein